MLLPLKVKKPCPTTFRDLEVATSMLLSLEVREAVPPLAVGRR